VTFHNLSCFQSLKSSLVAVFIFLQPINFTMIASLAIAVIVALAVSVVWIYKRITEVSELLLKHNIPS